ncbi:MAG: hypothetical protein KKD55_03280 [Candidatus Omnitrophica bacterium]|nr:hypothetical protein [Candidatus Omnitrophota bacterium]
MELCVTIVQLPIGGPRICGWRMSPIVYGVRRCGLALVRKVRRKKGEEKRETVVNAY